MCANRQLVCLASVLVCAVLAPPAAHAQFTVFTDENQFLDAAINEVITEFEEVADNSGVIVTTNGAMTRDSVDYLVTSFGNPGVGSIIGRDRFESIGQPPYNLGSGDFLLADSDLSVTVTLNFEDVDPQAVGFRVDDQNGTGNFDITVRTIDPLNTIATHNLNSSNGGANFGYFGFVSTTDARVLDVVVARSTGNNSRIITMDRVTHATPAPASLSLAAIGFSAIGIALRRNRKNR